MDEVRTILFGFPTVYAGLACCCLSQRRQRQRMLGRAASARGAWGLRFASIPFLSLAWILIAGDYGPLAATAWWCGLATAAALVLVVSLAYAPRLALGILMLSALGAAGQLISRQVG
jgi:hypothetical protein